MALGDRWSLFPEAALGLHHSEQHLKLLSDASRADGRRRVRLCVWGRSSDVDGAADPLEMATVNGLFPFIGESINAWLVLHEIGHHVLGHTARAPDSLAASRSDELLADRWAFAQMKRIGITLWGANRFADMRAQLEQVDSMLKAVPDEEHSTHPSWSRRAAELRKNFDVETTPPAEPLRLFATVIRWQTADMPARNVRLFLGGTSGCGRGSAAWVGSVKLGDEPASVAICDERAGQIWLYQRSPVARVEFVIETPSTFVTRVKMRSIALVDGKDGPVIESEFPALHVPPTFVLAYRSTC